jgi:hypothetical protein
MRHAGQRLQLECGSFFLPRLQDIRKSAVFDRLPDFAHLTCESSAKVKLGVEQRWNDTDRAEQNYCEKALSRWHFACHISHME